MTEPGGNAARLGTSPSVSASKCRLALSSVPKTSTWLWSPTTTAPRLPSPPTAVPRPLGRRRPSLGWTRFDVGASEDTMIFSHFQRPIGMRQTRIGKRIYVHRVRLDTSWFCPYCCATVDTAYVTLQRHRRKQSAYVCWPHSSISYPHCPLSLSGVVWGRSHKVRWAACILSPAILAN